MNIIKMAEDERKKDEEKIRQKHRAKFINVIHQFDNVEEEMREYYRQEQRDNWRLFGDGENHQNGYVLGDLFWTIKQMNKLYTRNDYDEDDYEEDIESYRERMAEENWNNPDEDAYDWGDEDEPRWA
jgi:uncharacterized protein with PIN domain